MVIMDKNRAYLRDMTPYRGRALEQAFLALRDDVGGGDITTLAVSLEGDEVDEKAVISSREEGVLCGVEEARELLKAGGLEVRWEKAEGDHLEPGCVIARVRGDVREMLSRERTALNYLQILSGVATLCSRFSERFPGRVASLRKTHPGLVFSEKRAVVVGGVLTHRLGLFDGFLIKDNHLALIARELFGDRVDINEDLKVKAVEEALRRVKKYRDEHEVLASLFVEVEVESLAQAVAAAEMYRSEGVPDMVLLDNMSPAMVGKCVGAIRCVAGPGILVEASGGVTPENLASYLGSGVDVASMSFLTLDARPLDIAMKIVGYK